MKNALIILAGGKGKRFKNVIPKQFIKIGKYNLIEYFLTKLDKRIFDLIVISTSKYNQNRFLKNLKEDFSCHKIIFSPSGKNRQDSSKNSLEILLKNKPKNVLIHDAARPFV